MIRNASLDTNFGRADSFMSRLTSELRDLDRWRQECYEDMDVYDAPSECGSLINKSYSSKRRAIFKKYNIEEYDYFEFVAERTTGKWVYNNLTIY